MLCNDIMVLAMHRTSAFALNKWPYMYRRTAQDQTCHAQVMLKKFYDKVDML